MKQTTLILIFSFFAASCSDSPTSHIQLKDFIDDVSVQKLGQGLIDLPYGLNALESGLSESEEILIAVHGSRSQGYEWVYPLKSIDSLKKEMYFYRWPDQGCFEAPAEKLIKDISNILLENPSLNKVILIGHSYGGILVSDVLKKWANKIPVEAHIIASPLAGSDLLINSCNYSPIKKIKANSALFEWRTQHQLDSAFKDTLPNPQDISIIGSSITILPDTYKGNRLGHNWSISWVADEVF
ncbi:alpha/beta fold hydrolase [Gammaproteobacteria bacterium]|jgi:pimeloyl-ACP methyl ester carboxylesterase|nr:alpha/beta fold hydrolase [Gammaproteobacteria bacterium]